MARKHTVTIKVLDVRHVTVSGDGHVDAVIGLEMQGEGNADLVLNPAVLAKLEAMLAKANAEQAKFQTVQ